MAVVKNSRLLRPLLTPNFGRGCGKFALRAVDIFSSLEAQFSTSSIATRACTRFPVEGNVNLAGTEPIIRKRSNFLTQLGKEIEIECSVDAPGEIESLNIGLPEYDGNLPRVDGVFPCLDGSSSPRRRIAFCTENKLYTEVISLLSCMPDKSVPWDDHTIASRLRACCDTEVSLDFLQIIHAKIILCGFNKTQSVYNALIDLYLRNHFVDTAFQILRKLCTRGTKTWVAMISGLSNNYHDLVAVRLYCDMRRVGAFPTPYVFSSVISACTKINLYELGKQFHAIILKWGFSKELYVCNSLLALYSRCGDLAFAELIFAEMWCRDEVSYNTLISGLAMQGSFEKSFEIFGKMQGESLVNSVTVTSLLGTCASLGFIHKGMQLHCYATKVGMFSDVKLEGSLLHMYVKCSDVRTAHNLFLESQTDNVVLWNEMLVAYGQMGDLLKSFHIYQQMQVEGLQPNQYTYPSILRTCICVGACDLGKQVHTQVIKGGLSTNVYVCSVLIDMYAKLGNLEAALKIFRRHGEDDIVSWTAMIAGYAQEELFTEALKLFVEMRIRRIQSDNIVLASAVSACAGIHAPEQGRQIHSQSIVSGYSSDISIGNALISLYARCALVAEAQLVFENMHFIDAVSWNSLISGYAQSGKSEEALKVLSQMIQSGEETSIFTYGSSISAVGNLTDLKLGKQIHGRTLKTGYDSEVEVCNALITFYAKCGRIDDARRMFGEMPHKNEVSWNAMITGYSQHGYGRQAIELFEDMKTLQMMPNHITYLGVLTACSHVGLVEEGLCYFKSMTEHHGLVPRPDHYASVVDILGRAGQVSRARSFLESIPVEPGSMAWRALLSACTVYRNAEVGQVAAKHLIELEPRDSATYVLMSNMYAVTGKWDYRDQARRLMRDRGVKKEPGRSWIEVKNSVHAFFVGDRLHPLADDIYNYLADLNARVAAIGYVQDGSSLWSDLELGEKDPTACIHSEKLAIAFGLLSLSKVIPLHVMKNLRVCSDCHNWIKFVTKAADRSIIVRDAYRFHHFENGACSCKDYW